MARKNRASGKSSMNSPKDNNNNNNNGGGGSGSSRRKYRGNNAASHQARRGKMPHLEPVPPQASQAVIDYGLRLIDPLNTNAVLSPLPASVRALAIKKKLVIDLKDHYTGSGSGKMFAVMKADAINTLNVTTTQDDVQDDQPIEITGVTPSNGSDSSQVGSELPIVDFKGSHNDMTQVPSIIGPTTLLSTRGSSGSNVYAITLRHSALNMTLRGKVEWSLNGSTNWTVAGDVTVTPNMNANAGTVSAPGGSNLYWRWSASGPGVKWVCTITPTTGDHGLKDSVTKTVQRSIKLFDKVTDAQYYTVTACEFFTTYLGGQLNSGGHYAGAMVHKDWQPDAGESPVEAISALPNDSYNGPLREGGHMHWIPSAPGELIPGPINGRQDHLFKYVIGIDADDITQSTRLQITMHIQYYSTEAAYGAMCYTPDPKGLGTLIAYLNASVPVSTSNDSHIVQKARKLLSSGAKYGLNYVLQHPEYMATAAKAIMAALAL